MTLLELREQLVKNSGRTDLVVDTTNYADNGADWFIQAGQRFLDDKLPTPKSVAEVKKIISSGEASVSFVDVRAVKRVRISENGEKPALLERKGLFTFYQDHGDKAYVVSQESGKPQVYTLGILRDDTPEQTQEEERQILFTPKADKTYTLTITAEYFSAPLEQDSDKSFWSLVYPEVLILAARRQMEVSHRNTQGVQDFERQIMSKLQDIDSNVVSENASSLSQMKNAY